MDKNKKEFLKAVLRYMISTLAGAVIGFLGGCSWYGTGVGLTLH